MLVSVQDNLAQVAQQQLLEHGDEGASPLRKRLNSVFYRCLKCALQPHFAMSTLPGTHHCSAKRQCIDIVSLFAACSCGFSVALLAHTHFCPACLAHVADYGVVEAAPRNMYHTIASQVQIPVLSQPVCAHYVVCREGQAMHSVASSTRKTLLLVYNSVCIKPKTMQN